MSMMSPESFAKTYENMSWKELTEVRIALEKDVLQFERNRKSEDRNPHSKGAIIHMDPDPELVYEMDLEYLAELFKMTAEAYRRERCMLEARYF